MVYFKKGRVLAQDGVDDHLRHVAHGQTVRSGDGPEHRLTVREMFRHVLDRLGPDATVTVDLAVLRKKSIRR